MVSGAGVLSPDGERVLFSPLFRDFRTWKRYEGGWAQDLFIFEIDGSGSRNITDHARTDRDPMWVGDKIYYVSDRTGKLNIYAYDPAADAWTGETLKTSSPAPQGKILARVSKCLLHSQLLAEETNLAGTRAP